MPLTLTRHAFETTLWPERGALIGQTRWQGMDILRSAAAPQSGLDAGCFPMVPFCNRIQNGLLQWQQQAISLPANFAPEPHAIHGFGWQQPWQVVQHSSSKALLRHDYEGDLWPCHYRAEQLIEVLENGLRVVLRVANRSARVAPLALGLHPYFHCDQRTRLHTALGPQWCLGENRLLNGDINEQHELTDTRLSGQPMAHLALDHLFTCRNSRFVITQPSAALKLEATFSRSARFVQIYSPAMPEKNYLCVEPVSMLSGAFCVNRELAQALSALDWVEPGQTLKMTLTLRASSLVD